MIDGGSDALTWRFPGLRAGEKAVHHVAAAWAANNGDDETTTGRGRPWLVVDTTHEALLRAGVQ